jgi:hypothetical protein
MHPAALKLTYDGKSSLVPMFRVMEDFAAGQAILADDFDSAYDYHLLHYVVYNGYEAVMDHVCTTLLGNYVREFLGIEPVQAVLDDVQVEWR